MVSSVSSVLAYILGAVSGVIGTLLVVYCIKYKTRRGKLDLTQPAAAYEDVVPAAGQGPVYEDVASAPPHATAPAPYEQVKPTQLQLKENVAYGQLAVK